MVVFVLVVEGGKQAVQYITRMFKASVCQQRVHGQGRARTCGVMELREHCSGRGVPGVD